MADPICPEPRARGESLPHRLACLAAGATFLLLFIGGLVTTQKAALAVPDWPTTFGHNMFFFPWSKMVGGIFYEHSHRLVASGVGLLTLALALALWWGERRAWLRWLGAAALALVIAQGVVGGLRVILLEETLAILHACLAQAFFALIVGLAFLTSTEWVGASPRIQLPDTLRIRRLCLITTVLIYLQAIVGAVLRHTGTGLEGHLFLATMVAFHVILLGRRVLKSPAGPARLKRSAGILVGLLFLQLGLGLGAYWIRIAPSATRLAEVVFTTAHVAMGAALLAASVALTLRSFRLLAPPEILAERVSARQVSV